MKKYILSLDQGTTSSRTVVFDRQGKIRSMAQYEFGQIYPQPGWVEHDAMEILFSQMLSMAEAVKSGGINPAEIAAIGITNQRETVVAWDSLTGKPVCNAIVWQCRRSAPFCEELKKRGLEPLITEKTGLMADPYFSGTKIRWILDHIPSARLLLAEGRLRCGTVDSWLIWNLTGGRVFATDYSNASRTLLFNLDTLTWDQELGQLLGVPLTVLPEVRPSSGDFGQVAKGLRGIEELAGIPICGAAGDQQAALFGQACCQKGDAKNTYGTGCFLLMNTGTTRVRSKSRLLSTVAWSLDGKVEYALEGSVFNAGSAIKWLRDDLHMISSAPECDKLAEECPENNGVYFVPAFTGLGAPHWDMYARGLLCGLTRGSGRGHIARAVLESIAFQVKDLLDAMMADSGIRLASLKVDGGASVSNVMMQFQADILETTVDRPFTVETTAMGAAFLAGLHCGFWTTKEEVAALRQPERLFQPDMPKVRRQELLAGWKKALERARL
ncbi:MAG: glycerol kinase GlpK [Peptococcaceae bacterium]|nr:glycerol kinase GlpK [Peptococcaceae bacterium]